MTRYPRSLTPLKAGKGVTDGDSYKDIPGFCRSVDIKTIESHRWALVPGRYVGFDRSELSTTAIGKLKGDFADLKAALINLPSEVEQSITIFEELFHG